MGDSSCYHWIYCGYVPCFDVSFCGMIYSTGKHYWEVKVERCVSKNIFVGVCSTAAALNSYVGSDRHGWGYLATRTLWHSRGKLKTYGAAFGEGDCIGVTLDMDTGILSFKRFVL